MRLHRYGSDHWVGLHPRTQRVVVLSEIGRYIWRAHRLGVSVQAISRRLSRLSGKPRAVVEADAERLLASISALGRGEAAMPEAPARARRSSTPEIPAPAPGPSTRHFRLGPALIAIRASQPLFDELLRPVFGHLETTATPDCVHLLIRVESDSSGFLLNMGEQSHTFATCDRLVERILFELLESAYRVSRTLAVLHAGAVLHGERAWLFAAAQGSGKTTLVAALCAEGFQYLSDDLCPLNEDGELIPVPAPQAIKQGSWPVLNRHYPALMEQPAFQRLDRTVRYLAPAKDTSGCWERPWPVAGLVFPGYAEDAEASLFPLDALEKLQLLAQSNSLRGDGELGELLSWLEKTPAYRLTYRKADQAKALFETIASA